MSADRQFLNSIGLYNAIGSLGFAALPSSILRLDTWELVLPIDIRNRIHYSDLKVDKWMSHSMPGGAKHKHTEAKDLSGENEKTKETCEVITDTSFEEKFVNIGNILVAKKNFKEISVAAQLIADEILKVFINSIWEKLDNGHKKNPKLPYPNFTKSEISAYCRNVKFLSFTAKLTWEFRFEKFFIDPASGSSKESKYTAFSKLPHWKILAETRAKSNTLVSEVLKLLKEEFFKWEVIPNSSGGKIWIVKPFNGVSAVQFAVNENF